jgi:hypothetical protein
MLAPDIKKAKDEREAKERETLVKAILARAELVKARKGAKTPLETLILARAEWVKARKATETPMETLLEEQSRCSLT